MQITITFFRAFSGFDIKLHLLVAPFETINPNYTLIEIITSKSNHSLLQIKSSETKLKLMRVEEYLKELESTINQGKLLLDKNLIELKEEINKIFPLE